MADSLAIAEYLDEKYPETSTQTPEAFPKGILGLQIGFTADANLFFALDKT